MKKTAGKLSLLLSLITIFVGLFSYTAFAVPGAGILLQYNQPDGESFKAAQFGDEKFNWVTAETGEVITQDKDKYWKYAQKINGKIIASNYRYSKSGQRPVQIIKNNDVITMVKKGTVVSSNPKQVDSPSASSTSISSTQTSGSTFQASSGQPAITQKVLVLLVNFSDVKIKYSDAQWNSSWFGTTGSSVNGYYNEVSFGKFGFSPAEETYGTANDGVIRVTLNYPNPNTGGNIGSANQKIVSDALAAASPYINYASFDTNHNGRMEANELHIVTVCAGYEASYGGASPSIWAHRWVTSATVQGIGFSGYMQEGEVHYDHMATIGVLAHEIGHDLGLPDLYDTDYTSQGDGIHSIMAGGSWAQQVYPGDSPTHLDAWCEIKLGFVTPTVINGSGDYTVNSAATGQYNVLKVPTSNTSEYFLVENRQFEGYDMGLANRQKPSGGLAIWHVDDSIMNVTMAPNTNESHKGLDLEEANQGILGYSQLDTNKSGFYIGSTYYSGYSHYYFANNPSTIYRNTNVFGPTTVPNSSLYSGTSTGISILTNSSSSDSMIVTISSPGMQVAPVIGSVSASPNPFAPDGTKTESISYTVSKDVYVTLTIYDANNNLIRTIENNVLKTAGSITSSWDGKDASGNIVGDAVYTFKITAVDKYGLSANPAVGTITVEASKPKITNVSDSPKPYTGAANTYSTINYTLSENCSVTVKIYDSNGTLVNTLVNGQVGAGVRSTTWNGKDSLGKSSKSGIYTYKINAVDGFNNAADEVAGTITLDRGAPINLILYGHKPDPFKVNTKITYGINQPGVINLKIYDSSNNLVRSLIKNSQRQAGTYYTTWTGMNDSGKAVPSGVYTYSVDAEDSAGNTAGPYTGNVTVDRTGPVITNTSVSDYPFVPNGSNNTTISYNLSKDGKFSANLYSQAGTLIRTLVNKASQSAGTNSFLWDGKNKYDEIVPDGTYTIKMSAIDTLGNKSGTVSQMVVIETTAPSIDNVSDSPDPLRLGDGSVNTIKYTLSKDAHVTVKIFDTNGNLVNTIADSDTYAGVRTALWDGTNSNGAVVGSGTYVYKINAVDAFEKAAKEVTGTIATDGTPVIISSVSINPTTFMPSGAIFYTISKDAKVTLKIYNSSNQEVKTIENGTPMTSGVHSSVWDGKTASGADALPGSYTFRITAVDNSGFNAVPAVGSITLSAVDKTAPTITNVSDSPDPIKLGTGGLVSIKYTLSEDSFVTLKIYDSKNNLVRTLINRNISAGDKVENWDGKDDLGVLLPDDTYIYRINATDNSGNVGNEAVGTITTDKIPVTISSLSINPAKFATSGNINYTISENAVITISIYDGSNNEVRRLVNAQSMNGGSNSTLWDGSDSSGFVVPSGNYTYVITAIDKVGFLATAQGTINVDAPAPVISNQSSSPEPFIADGNGLATISYTISSNASATLKIYNGSGKIVRTLQNGTAVLRGQNSVSWNGRSDGGVLQSDGVYTYKIYAVDAVGKASNEAVGTITIDKTAPAITNVSADPNPFAAGSSTKIGYTLSEKAYITITIADGNGNIIRTLENGALKNAGVNTALWDGKDGSGNILTGTFTYKISAVDLAKFTSQALGSVTEIDSSTPIISSNSSSPEPFAPNGSNIVNITYILSKDMNVSVGIYDQNGNLIKTLIGSVHQLKGNNSTWWDGKSETGNLVPEGVYTYKINGVDGLGTSAAEVKGKITAAIPLSITNDSVSSDPFKAFNKNIVSITYTLSKDANIIVAILDASNNAVKTLFGGPQSSGTNSASWDGTGVDGSIVQDGMYTYKIDAADLVGQKASVTRQFTVVGSDPEITNVTVSPNPYKPDGSLASINYTLSKNSLTTIEIFDSNGKLVRQLFKNLSIVKGPITSYWEGKDSSGSIVPDGIYTIKITAVDPYSKVSVQYNGSITVQMYPPAGSISAVSITPNPYAQNSGASAAITYTLSGTAYITTSIYDSNNNLVRTIENKLSKTSGTYNAKWDGKDSSGRVVSDGLYSVNISALNGAGLGSTTTNNLTVESTPPVISGVSDTPDPFKPDYIALWSLNFNMTEDANVYLEVRDSSSSVVWTARPVIFTKGTRTVQLYGTNDSGQLLNDGVYTYKLWAVDFSNKKSNEATGTFTVDRTAPVISGVGASPSPFGSSTTISYSLSEKAAITIEIYSGNTLIKILEKNILTNSGTNSVAWDGSDDKGIAVADGTYSYKITAVDGVGLSGSATGNLIKSTGSPVISNVGTSLDIFRPVGSNTITISYSLNKDAYVGINIFDSNGKLVRTLLKDYPGVNGMNSAGWDGRDDSGAIVGDGNYTFRISAVDLTGASAVQVGGTITIDRTAPIISSFSANPYPFAPDGSSTMTIGYNLSENAKVTVSILDDSNNVLTTLANVQSQNLGANQVKWDGTSNGSILDDDIYRVKVTAVDMAGNSTDYYDFAAIDRFAPQILDVYDEPDPFNPNVAQFNTIHAGFSENISTATAAIYDSSNAQVKNIGMNDILEFFWGWSGKDASGKLVKDGVYTYKIDASDMFSKDAQEAGGTITVDTTVPIISQVSFTPELETPSGTINYNLSKVGKVNITIYDNYNNPVRYLERDAQKNAGSNSSYWDGKDNSGKLIGYGIYTFKITAVDANGAAALPVVGVITFETIDPDVIDNTINETDITAAPGTGTTAQPTQPASGSVQVPVQGPNNSQIMISDVSDTPDPIKVGVVSIIKFSTSQNANVTVKLFDAHGNLIKVLLDKSLPAGAQITSWDGKDSKGTQTVDGIYTYKIDANAVTSAIATGTITVVNSRPVVTGVSTYPQIFAPNGTIKYTIQDNLKVTTVIYDSTNKIIRILETKVQKASGSYIVNWDGKDQTGTLVSSGVYGFKITFENGVGLTTEASGNIIVDSSKLSITASFTPNPYNPRGGNGGFAPATIYYNLSETASITAGIYKTDGSVVKVLSSGERKDSGINGFIWIGIDDKNTMIQPGTYTYKISGVTDSGKRGETSGTFTVQ